jgi:hypothetical protein
MRLLVSVVMEPSRGRRVQWRNVLLGHLPIGWVTVGLLAVFVMSGKRSGNIIFRLPKHLVSPCEPAHPQGCKPTRWLIPELTMLKVFRQEAVVGNLSNEEWKALQDEHREDTRDEAVSNIECDYSESRSGSLVKARQEWLRRTRNEDDSQEARKSISLLKHVSTNN